MHRTSYKNLFVMLISAGVFCMMAPSCGMKSEPDDEEVSGPDPTPTVVSGNEPQTGAATPTPTVEAGTLPTAAPTPEPKIYVGSTVGRFIAAYDVAGTRLGLYDLSPYFSSGGITAMTFFDRNTLLAFYDPGASNERIVKIDLQSNTINANWGVDGTNLNNVAVSAFVIDSASKLFVQRAATSSIQYTYNVASNILIASASNGWPMTSTGSCPITTVNDLVKVSYSSSTYFLQLSSGANSRINTWSNPYSSLSCPAVGNSYNYLSSFPAIASSVAISGIQMSDGKIYIRYGHTSTPQVSRYDFSGTTLVTGSLVANDAMYLGVSTTLRTKLVSLDDSTLLLPNWDSDYIFKLKTDGTIDGGIFIRDGFTVDVGAIAIRPDL